MEKIFKFFIKDKLIVNMVIAVIIGAGIYNMFDVNREIFPATDSDTMNISVSYPGASAEDVELNALLPIEEALGEINGISEYVGLATDNSSSIHIELDDDVSDLQAVKDEIYRNISLSSLSDVSSDVEKINVSEMSAKKIPVVRLALAAKEGTTKDELFTMADTLDRILTKVDGVSEVSESGYLDKQVHVVVDPLKMDDAYVAINDLVSAIEDRNVRSSSGTIQSVTEENNILTIGEFQDPMDVGNVIIRSGFEGKKVTVGDIADIIMGYEDSDVTIRANGFKTVVLTVRKKETADSIKTVNNILETLEKEKGVYENKFELIKLMDTSDSIRSQIKAVLSNAAIGFVLVIIILLIFLDFKTAFWTAFSIPLCLLIVMIFLNVSNNTINIISLGAIITVLGMLVDDAIVVAETIYYKKEQGMKPLEAALEGVKEVIGPVTVTILSTVIAFMPMVLIQGRMGHFIHLFPIVISVTLLASLAEAAFLLPNHLAYGKSKAHVEKGWFSILLEGYRKLLAAAIKFRYIVLIGFILMFIGSFLLAMSGMKSFKLSRDHTSQEIVLDLEAKSTVSLDEMEEMAAKVEQVVMATIPENEFTSMMTYVGEHSNSMVEGNHTNWATIDIQLVTATARERDTRTIMSDLRKVINLEKFPDFGEITFKESRFGPDTGDAIDVKVISNNLTHSNEVVDKLMAYLTSVNGVKDISSDLSEGKNEILIKFDYDKLAEYSLTVADVASSVRTAYEGATATSVRTLANDLEFKVEIADKYKKNKKFLLNLLVSNSSGNLVKLGEVAYLEETLARDSIRHYNGERSTSVTADVDDKVITPMQANMMVEQEFGKIANEYPDVTLDFQGEMKETNTALAGLGISYIIALVMIYLILLVLFRSAGQPLIVMAVIPFGLIGVFLAFWAHNTKLTFMAIIGVIGLSGVVVNDSIIMVEFINKVVRDDLRKKSEGSIIDDICQGASRRLRPIMLTTITTVLALLPSVYGWGGANVETLKPTTMAMAYGLLFATLLTLIFIPVLYMIGDDLRSIFAKIFGFQKVEALPEGWDLEVSAGPEVEAEPEEKPKPTRAKRTVKKSTAKRSRKTES